MKPSDIMRRVGPVLERRGPVAIPPDPLRALVKESLRFIAHAWDCDFAHAGVCRCGANALRAALRAELERGRG